jgi:hypothetical protein
MITYGMPNVMSAVMAWARPTNVYLVLKRQQDFKTIETFINRTVNMIRQPSNQTLEMKVDGQRKWIDEIIYTEAALELKVDDVIIFNCENGERFRVMDKVDWSANGFIEYKIKSDYKK